MIDSNDVVMTLTVFFHTRDSVECRAELRLQGLSGPAEEPMVSPYAIEGNREKLSEPSKSFPLVWSVSPLI